MTAGSKRLLGIVLFTILFSATTYADPFTFNTIPAGGSLTAAAGSTVGWGYTVTNNSADKWLVFNSVGTDIVFHDGTANGFVFNAPIVAPGDTITQPYDGVDGLYEFTWDAGAAPGTVNAGNFVLDAEWWDGDPFGTGQFFASIADFNAPFSISVPSGTCQCTALPAPSSFPLLAGGLGVLLFFSFRASVRSRLPRARMAAVHSS